MTDFLKKTIDQRRESFELFETDLDLAWEEIDRRLHGEADKKVVPLYRSWWNGTTRLAASVALLGLASVILLWVKGEPAAGQPTLSMVSAEMAETEQYYSMMISEKLGEIESSGKWVDEAVMKDILALDQAYSELREDLADNADNEEVIDAMIINYKIKLEVLDRILAQIKEAKNGEDRKNPTL